MCLLLKQHGLNCMPDGASQSSPVSPSPRRHSSSTITGSIRKRLSWPGLQSAPDTEDAPGDSSPVTVTALDKTATAPSPRRHSQQTATIAQLIRKRLSWSSSTLSTDFVPSRPTTDQGSRKVVKDHVFEAEMEGEQGASPMSQRRIVLPTPTIPKSLKKPLAWSPGPSAAAVGPSPRSEQGLGDTAEVRGSEFEQESFAHSYGQPSPTVAKSLKQRLTWNTAPAPVPALVPTPNAHYV